MTVRVTAAGAIQGDARKNGKAMLLGAQGMLAGQDQPQGKPAPLKGGGDWCKLDGFWTGSDDDVGTLD
jgi:hypothetical protein